jgi:hypothetical protein
MDRIDDPTARAIASRVRTLLAGLDADGLDAAARRLGVGEVPLRMTVDEAEPHPTLEVLAAVTRHFGVDPTWLLTGTYDPATHHAAMDGGRPEESLALLATLVRRPAGGAAPAGPPPVAARRDAPAPDDSRRAAVRRARDEYLRETERRALREPEGRE